MGGGLKIYKLKVELLAALMMGKIKESRALICNEGSMFLIRSDLLKEHVIELAARKGLTDIQLTRSSSLSKKW
jgi:hypothetical protein